MATNTMAPVIFPASYASGAQFGSDTEDRSAVDYVSWPSWLRASLFECFLYPQQQSYMIPARVPCDVFRMLLEPLRGPRGTPLLQAEPDSR